LHGGLGFLEFDRVIPDGFIIITLGFIELNLVLPDGGGRLIPGLIELDLSFLEVEFQVNKLVAGCP
jgi:hypothetical protein